MSQSADGASAHAADESVNRDRPPAKTLRRPRRSPAAAAVMIPAAYASVNALTAHSRVVRLAPSSRWIEGRAAITTRASRLTMKKAIAVTLSVQWGCDRVLSDMAHPLE